MKTIGLIGGMSWESSLEYYRIINETVKEKLGKSHSCENIMYSVDFTEYDELQHEGKWELITEKILDIANKLERAGADFVVICTNTIHKVAEDVQKNIDIPLLHIADTAAEEIKSKKLDKVGLLGTKFTMEQDFYKERISKNYGIDVIIPEAKERKVIHQVIYKELVSGILRDESREKFKNIIQNLKVRGAEGVIMGCTEIPLLINNDASILPVFNTTELHAQKAVELALG